VHHGQPQQPARSAAALGERRRGAEERSRLLGPLAGRRRRRRAAGLGRHGRIRRQALAQLGHRPPPGTTRRPRSSWPRSKRTAGILFRAFGGDPGLNVAAATADTHGARRRWLQRVAGSNEKVALARRDAETLRLPPEIAAFPEKALNRDLYLWLAALAATDVAPDQPWFIRNQLASQAALTRYPGLRPRYERLVPRTSPNA
jgi:hypothetical protein